MDPKPYIGIFFAAIVVIVFVLGTLDKSQQEQWYEDEKDFNTALTDCLTDLKGIPMVGYERKHGKMLRRINGCLVWPRY